MLESKTIAIANVEIPTLKRTLFVETFTRSRTPVRYTPPSLTKLKWIRSMLNNERSVRMPIYFENALTGSQARRAVFPMTPN